MKKLLIILSPFIIILVFSFAIYLYIKPQNIGGPVYQPDIEPLIISTLRSYDDTKQNSNFTKELIEYINTQNKTFFPHL